MGPSEWTLSLAAITLSLLLMIHSFRLGQVIKLRLNVISVMYLCHISMQLAASILFLNDNSAIVSHSFFIACSITALLIPLGGLAGNLVLPASNRLANSIHRSEVAKDSSSLATCERRRDEVGCRVSRCDSVLERRDDRRGPRFLFWPIEQRRSRSQPLDRRRR